MTAKTKEAPKTVAVKGANKEEPKSNTVKHDNMIAGYDIEKLISMERKGNAVNSSINRDQKLNKFVNNEFKLPKAFRPGELDKALGNVRDTGIMELGQKIKVLKDIASSDLDEQVELKVADFEGWPLETKQRDALNARKSEYKEFLSGYQAAAKRMLQKLDAIK